jgi:hypothetical protein
LLVQVQVLVKNYKVLLFHGSKTQYSEIVAKDKEKTPCHEMEVEKCHEMEVEKECSCGTTVDVRVDPGYSSASETNIIDEPHEILRSSLELPAKSTTSSKSSKKSKRKKNKKGKVS